MTLPRPIKMLGALMSGQVILLANQLLIPPLFLSAYGVVGLGEWLTLTAAVNYLGTLNFGIQTFANNHVGISCNRNEIGEAKSLQATAFATLLAIVLTAAVATIPILFLPIASLLHLKASSQAASLTIYLLGLQILTKMLFSFLAGSFLAVGLSHRGAHWNNLLTVASLLLTATMAVRRLPFSFVAFGQLAITMLATAAVAIDLRAKAPVVIPDLRLTDTSRIKSIVIPSGYFAMLFSSNFLVYQLPIIFMQRALGPEKVVVFSLTRTIFSMSRQILNSMSFSIAPEIVELYAQGNWPRLLKLYDLSERVIFALVPVVSFGTLLASPVLMAIWLHRPHFFDLTICLFMAAISAVMGTKEHKYQFQTAANQHTEMARFWFVSYLLLVGLSVPAVLAYGTRGFLALWLLTEVIQLVYVVRLNRRFLGSMGQVNLHPIYKLAVITAAAIGLCAWIMFSLSGGSLIVAAVVAIVLTSLLGLIGYTVFGISEVGYSVFKRIGAQA